MLRELTIKNYKSILDHTIELGRINVFIGENGCGKTNILEAVAMAAAAVTNKLTVEDLFNRGMRVARPALIRSSFPGANAKDVDIRCTVEDASRGVAHVGLRLSEMPGAGKSAGWSVVRRDLAGVESRPVQTRLILEVFAASPRGLTIEEIRNELSKRQDIGAYHEAVAHAALRDLLGDFGVYDASTLALRGLATVSRRAPLGLYGETLDDAIYTLDKASLKDLQQRARRISWLEKFAVDTKDTDQYAAHKLGASQSKLFFHDRHMRRKNNIFSAENANEGILHVLFHLTLFMHPDTPRVLGIDNIETALNPQLCRDLMAQLPELAEKHGKQALITTHNPAILDGLNLLDDEQRLFVVARDDEGHTVAKRIKQKEQPKDAPFKHKLSELWMRGHLGGLPETF